MRRRLRYFRLFAFMTALLLVVSGIYRIVRRSSATQEHGSQESSSAPQYSVIVAAQDLPPYTLLTADHVTVRKMATPPPSGTFSDPQQVTQRLTRVYIRAGEVVRLADVTPPLRDGALANALPPGMVGMSLLVARREQVPPVRPGDVLRIYAAFARTKVQPVAMRALVLAVNGSTAGPSDANAAPQSSSSPSGASSGGTSNPPAPPGAPLTLLIAVPPDEARAIALALDSGATLYYALLPPSPLTPMIERALTLRELTGLGSNERPEGTAGPAAPPAPRFPPPRRSQELRFVTPSPVVVPPASPTRSTPAPTPASDKPVTSAPSQPMHQVFGVVGDRPVVLSVPVERKGGEQ